MNLEAAKKMLESIPVQYPVILCGSYGDGKETIVMDFAKENGLTMADIRLSQQELGDIIGLEVPDEGFITPLWWQKDIIYFDELEIITPDIHIAIWNAMIETHPLDGSPGDRWINGKPLRRNQRIIFGLNSTDLRSLNFDPVFWSKTVIIKIGE